MKIYNDFLYSRLNYKKVTQKQNFIQANTFSNPINLNNYSYNDYLMFTSKVDKGLERFYEFNKERMPLTLKNYIDLLDSKDGVEPIDALVNAFEGLIIADNIKDVKDYFEDEPLFQNLVPIEKTRPSKGLLYDIKVMQKDLDEYGETVLSTGEDLSVYLLKKIFLEAKSLPEINEDLNKDLNPVFQKEDKKYIAYSTFEALGIQLPSKEYLTSLRYTKPGYSEEIGRRIAEIQKGKSRTKTNDNSENTKVKRATNKKIDKFIDGLKREPKEKSVKNKETSEKRKQSARERWDNYTPEEKQAIIERLLAASTFQHYIMINAWNHLEDVILKMSAFFKNKNIYNIEKVLYDTKTYSSYQSAVMKAFWQENPECAQRLGEEISNSYESLRRADEEGRFDEFIQEVEKTAEIRKKEIKKTKHKQKNDNKEKLTLHEEFTLAFKTRYPYYPNNYIENYAEFLEKGFEGEKDFKLLIKGLKGKATKEEQTATAKKIRNLPYHKGFSLIFRAIETASKEIIDEASNGEFSELIYCSKNINQMLEALYQQKEYPFVFDVKPSENNSDIEKELPSSITIYKRPDFEKLEELYEKYAKRPSTKAKNYVYQYFMKNAGPHIKDFVIQKQMEELVFETIESYGGKVDEVYNNPASKISSILLKYYLSHIKRTVFSMLG